MSRIRIALIGAAVVALVGIFVGSGLAASKKTAVTTPVVKVSGTEFHFTLSQKSVPKPGKVIFKFTNNGHEPHNFVFLSGINKGTPAIAPHKTATLTVTFKKKGSYTYECTVGEHAEEGMLGTFTVK